MKLHVVTNAKWIREFIVELTFDNSRRAQVDLKRYLGKGVFKSLINLKEFKKFKVDPELGTLAWPNGADIDPQTLYQDAFHNDASDELSDAA